MSESISEMNESELFMYGIGKIHLWFKTKDEVRIEVLRELWSLMYELERRK